MKPRYIVVDDAAFLRELLKNIANEAGCICVGEAANGEEALIAVRAFSPDFMFLDMVMPGKNGIETARVVKALFPQIRIIGCSTLDDQDLINASYEVGFDAYIVKPFSKDQIINTIKNFYPNLKEA